VEAVTLVRKQIVGRFLFLEVFLEFGEEFFDSDFEYTWYVLRVDTPIAFRVEGLFVVGTIHSGEEAFLVDVVDKARL
jgi:hypothetical protein